MTARYIGETRNTKQIYAIPLSFAYFTLDFLD